MGDHQESNFPTANISAPTTSLVSITNSFTAVHNFKVTSYSLLNGMGFGKFVSSSTFTVGGSEWAVRLFPDGYAMTYAGNVSVLLYYCGLHTKVRATFSLGLVEECGRFSNVSNSSYIFSPTNNICGFARFVEKSKLQGSLFLKNDCVAIRCVLTVMKDSRTEDVEMNPIVVPLSNLHQHFKNMLNEGARADVEFTVCDKLFRAHRYVLAFRSPVFKAELFGTMKENATKCSVKIVDMDPMIFEALLHFIYTDSLPDNYKDGKAAEMQQLLVAADRYGMDRLRLICERKLSETINVETVGTTLVFADQHNCSQLRQACIRFMASPNMLGPVIGTDGFKHLMASCPLIMKDILDNVSHIWSGKSF